MQGRSYLASVRGYFCLLRELSMCCICKIVLRLENMIFVVMGKDEAA